MNNAILQRFDLDGRTVVNHRRRGRAVRRHGRRLGDDGCEGGRSGHQPGKGRDPGAGDHPVRGTALAFGCDVLDAVQLRECCEAISAAWGPPDLLINGAGGNDPRGSTSVEFEEPTQAGAKAQSFFDLDPAGFRHVFDLNFMGTFLTTQIFARGMVARGKGSIVNISSMSAFMPLTKVAAYSAAKAAVSNFTQWLAVHFSHAGVRVNALAPGFFMTEQLRFLHIDPATGELLPRARQVIATRPWAGTASRTT